MRRQIEKEAADILLGRRMKLPIPAPFFLRWCGVKTINLWVKLGTYGTGLRRSSYYASMGITQDQLENLSVNDAVTLFAKHGVTLSKMVATSILVSWSMHLLFTKLLAFYLRENTSKGGVELIDIVNWLIYYGDTKDFIDTTRSAFRLTITAPTMGQKVSGS